MVYLHHSSFLGSLGSVLLVGNLDDTDGNGLFHISDGESSQRRIFGEGLNAHGFAGLEKNQSRVTRLDELGFFFH